MEQVGSVRLGVQRSPSRQTGRFPTKYVRAANVTPAGIDVSDILEMDFTPVERGIYALRDGDVLLTEASGSHLRSEDPLSGAMRFPAVAFKTR